VAAWAGAINAAVVDDQDSAGEGFADGICCAHICGHILVAGF
jgi:hypothetical protein